VPVGLLIFFTFVVEARECDALLLHLIVAKTMNARLLVATWSDKWSFFVFYALSSRGDWICLGLLLDYLRCFYRF